MVNHPLMQSHTFLSTPHITPHILHRNYAAAHDHDESNNCALLVVVVAWADPTQSWARTWTTSPRPGSTWTRST